MKCCYILGFLSSLWACEGCLCWSHWSLIIKQTHHWSDWCNNERAAVNLVLNMWTQTPGRINEPYQRKHVPVEEPQHEEDPGGRDMKAGVRSDWTTGCSVIQWTRQLIGQRVPALDFLVLVFEAVEPVFEPLAVCIDAQRDAAWNKDTWVTLSANQSSLTVS